MSSVSQKRNVTILAAAAATLIVLGCRTVPIQERAAIRVPSGLTPEQVELAIVYALAQPPPGTLELKHQASKVTAEILATLFGADDDKGWFVEAREPGVVYAGYRQDSHYLSTAIPYNTTMLRVEILRSDNLDQSDTRIHKAVYVWITDLEVKIRQALGQL